MTRICSCEHLHLWKMKLKFFFVFLCHISLFRNYLMPFYVFCLCLSTADQSVQRWLYVVKLWVRYLLQLFEIKILLAKCSHCFILNTWSSAVGLVKQFPPLINFVFFKSYRNNVNLLNIRLIFDKCHHSWAAVTRVKYRYHSIDLIDTVTKAGMAPMYRLTMEDLVLSRYPV